MVKNPRVNAGDARDESSIPGSGKAPGVGNGNPLWYSCLENYMERGAWRATVHGVAKSQTQPSTYPPHKKLLEKHVREYFQDHRTQKDFLDRTHKALTH